MLPLADVRAWALFHTTSCYFGHGHEWSYGFSNKHVFHPPRSPAKQLIWQFFSCLDVFVFLDKIPMHCLQILLKPQNLEVPEWTECSQFLTWQSCHTVLNSVPHLLFPGSPCRSAWSSCLLENLQNHLPLLVSVIFSGSNTNVGGLRSNTMLFWAPFVSSPLCLAGCFSLCIMMCANRCLNWPYGYQT